MNEWGIARKHAHAIPCQSVFGCLICKRKQKVPCARGWSSLLAESIGHCHRSSIIPSAIGIDSVVFDDEQEKLITVGILICEPFVTFFPSHDENDSRFFPTMNSYLPLVFWFSSFWLFIVHTLSFAPKKRKSEFNPKHFWHCFALPRRNTSDESLAGFLKIFLLNVVFFSMTND